MNADTVQLVLDAGSVVLKFLGGISLVGVMAFVTAYYAFRPNLTGASAPSRCSNVEL